MSALRVLFCDDSGGVIKGFENNVGRPLAGIIEYVTASSVAGVEELVRGGESFDVVVTDLNFERVGGDHMDAAGRKKVRRNLLAYCERDTLAMVRIVERLRELAA